MTSIFSSLVLECSIPKHQLVSLSSPYQTKHHYHSCTSKFNNQKLRWSKNNRRTFFSPNASLQQIQSEENDDPRKLLVASIRDCLYSFLTEGELQFNYLGEALRIVDLIERLGIQRFFQLQIKLILDSIYRKWNEKYGLTEPNVTVLGFRLLRLHGYHANADVLKILRDKDGGNFSTFLVQKYDRECALLNLYKCSQIGFPEESKIMDEAEDFSKAQLVKLLSVKDDLQLDIKKTEEIEFSLSYPRQCMLPRMEATSIVKGSWHRSEVDRKCIELASIDLKMFQNLYQQERIEYVKWFMEQNFVCLESPKPGAVDIHFGAAMSMFEPQFSLHRLTYCKSYILISMLDKLHDNTRVRKGLNLFQEAFRRWDVSLVENHFPHKSVFESLQNSLTEIAPVVNEAQDRDLFPYMKETWEEAITAFNKEVEWKDTGYFPSITEYLKVGVNTCCAFAILSSVTLFLTGEKISEKATGLIGKDSRLLFLASLIDRLAKDVRTYKSDGKMINAITCYMKEHSCTEEAALMAMKKMSRDTFRELELEMFKCRGLVPEPCIRAVLACLVDISKLIDDKQFQEIVGDYMG